ncbi:dienelactone hydrolase family protein [Sphingomonas sp. AP4-R1]|uniref:dienelactone hydrolase family protein n=1 Tax=Sphingomonas sp. AP4-R1 TaxID=2735134 RepID=UPI001493347D|nr:dienelactone hydrolase family protein [Sphingomonas sp. AP4-R1]QJU57231.1 dienelactone hydrolase family protein [Sphingomonas sp. AP4-R1]
MGDRMDVAALDGSGSFSVYRALPSGPPKAAIIVIQEIFGVNAGIRQKADDWAALGYLALAPDMFWRFAPGYDVNPDVPEEMADAFEIRTKFNFNKGIEDVEAVIRAARALMTGGKVGIVGFCMGGGIAYLAATRTDVDASVGFYGAAIPLYLAEAHAIAKPLLLHFAEEDGFISQEARGKIHAALDGNHHVAIEEYAGVDHGFADTAGKRRSDTAALIAEGRTRDFFAGYLA